MRAAVFIASLAVSGCAGMTYMSENYPVRFDGAVATPQGSFSVTLHNTKAAFLTQVGAGEALGMALFSGLTLGAVERGVGGKFHEDAAIALLARIPARNCKVTRSGQIETITWEHEYACADGKPLTAQEVASPVATQ